MTKKKMCGDRGTKKWEEEKRKKERRGKKCKEGNEIIALSNTATEKEEKKGPRPTSYVQQPVLYIHAYMTQQLRRQL